MTTDKFGCGICWMPYTWEKRAPITLGCGHTLCRLCINMLSQGKMHVPCGLCKQKTYTDPKKLQKNVCMIEFLGQYDQIEQDPKEPPKRKNVRLAQPAVNNGPNANNPFGDRHALYMYEERFRLLFNEHPNHVPTSTRREEITAAGEAKMDEIYQLMHRAKEVITKINDEGDNLQIYLVENEDKNQLAKFIKQVDKVFKKVKELIRHPLRVDLDRTNRQLYGDQVADRLAMLNAPNHRLAQIEAAVLGARYAFLDGPIGRRVAYFGPARAGNVNGPRMPARRYPAVNVNIPRGQMDQARRVNLPQTTRTGFNDTHRIRMTRSNANRNHTGTNRNRNQPTANRHVELLDAMREIRNHTRRQNRNRPQTPAPQNRDDDELVVEIASSDDEVMEMA